MSAEAQLYNQLQLCITTCATLTQVPFDHHKVDQLRKDPAFPISPEIREDDQKLDQFVLMTDSFRECLYHLMEARKKLMLLGVHTQVHEEKTSSYTG